MSFKVTREITNFRNDCEEIRYMESELKKVDRYIVMEHKHRGILCQIGHDLHGHFDPDHVDFEVLCGTFHTERVAPFYPYFVLFAMLLSIIMFVVTELYYFVPLVVVNVPFVVLLRFAIKFGCHRKMLPYLFFAIFEKLLWLGTIIFLCVVVFNPHLPVYLIVVKMCETDMMSFRLAILLTVLVFSIDLFIKLYLDWNVLFHFVYLLHTNTGTCAHTANCPGKNDFDPSLRGRPACRRVCNKEQGAVEPTNLP